VANAEREGSDVERPQAAAGDELRDLRFASSSSPAISTSTCSRGGLAFDERAGSESDLHLSDQLLHLYANAEKVVKALRKPLTGSDREPAS
jgi:hypothetical protein